MPKVTVDALGNPEIVMLNDDVSAACRVHRDTVDGLSAHKPISKLPARGRGAPLWIAAVLLATTCASAAGAGPDEPRAQAGPPGVALELAPAGDPQALQRALLEQHRKAELLARELTIARHLEMLLTLQQARAESAQFKQPPESGYQEQRNSFQQERERLTQAAESGAAELCRALPGGRADQPEQAAAEGDAAQLRKSLQEERERAGRLEHDLAAARRDVETETALAAKATEQIAQLKQASDSRAAELNQSVQKEHDRAESLAQDLTTARTEIHTYEAQARQASDQAAKLQQAEDAAAELQKSLRQEQEKRQQLEQDLAAARRDVQTQTELAAKANDEATQLRQVAESGSIELKRSLQKEHDRADALTQELSAAHAAIFAYEAQARKASDQAADLKEAAESSAGDLRKLLEQERERATGLESDLAAARREAEKQTALLVQVSTEADRFRQAAKDEAELQKSLQQERDRTARLEQDLAAARRDVETQAALAAKANDDAARSKQTAENGSAELKRSLEKEHDRAEALAQNLSMVHTAIYTYEVQTRLANDEAASLKRREDSGAAELQKSLRQEQDKRQQLEQDLAASRRDVQTQTELAAKANDEATQLRQAAESGSIELKRSLQKEHDRADALTQELSTAHAAVYAYEAKARQANEQAADLKQAAESSAGDLRKSLARERERATGLEKDLAAARREVETQTALLVQASTEADRFRQAAKGEAELQKSLQQERDRDARLEQDLAAARHEIETQAALAAKANDDAAGSKQTAENGSAELKRSLQKEHDRAEALAQNLSMVHTAIYTYEVQTRLANNQAASLKRREDSGAAELRKSLVQAWERVAKLEKDLAAAKRDIQTQAALAARASDDASRAKQAAESGAAELHKPLVQQRGHAARQERELAAERKTKLVPATTGVATAGRVMQDKQSGVDAIRPVTANPTTGAAARNAVKPDAQRAVEVARLVAHASVLLGQGDIGSARIVLERAAETGNAQASFALAETYDPLVLRRWGAFGTLGDAAKARDLYAKAQAGGIREARERFDALRQ